MGKLTRKNKAVLDLIAINPEMTQTDAYMRINKTNSKRNANIQASKLVNKPESQIYLKTHVDKARKRVVDLISSDNESIALKASQDVLDREKGKATQRTETTTRKLTIDIDLTDGQGTIDATEELIEGNSDDIEFDLDLPDML